MIVFPIFEIAVVLGLSGLVVLAVYSLLFSEESEELADARNRLRELPESLKKADEKSSYLGWDLNLGSKIYFPDKVRSRHVHIMGATGSGKTESVLLNLIDQDAHRGHPIVIIDAKGDRSFVDFLKAHPNSRDRLLVFDVAAEDSVHYNPLASGSQSEAVSRLFNSMNWSEEFYKTRARETLLKLAENRVQENERVELFWLKKALESSGSLKGFLSTAARPVQVSAQEYGQLAGLVAQVSQLCYGRLGELIDGSKSKNELNLAKAIQSKKVIYFRLPALVDPVTTVTIGKLIIADLAYYSAQVQAGKYKAKFTPVYLDEFGSLACPAFLELVAKARSAGMALHFSHQSLGDLHQAGETFASQVNDNSSTKIVLRVYDPDTAEMVARTFGTHMSSKETKQVVRKSFGSQEDTGAMSVREVKEFRAEPDAIKSLPTGCAFVLMNHALRFDGSSSDVFKMRFSLPPKY